MAKRPLGLAKANKNKKSKNNDSKEADNGEDSRKITIEVDEEVDSDDTVGQLKALYGTYQTTKRQITSLEEIEDIERLGTCQKILAGIIHECDHMLRSAEQSKEQSSDITPDFHNVYALALLGMASFAEIKGSEGENREDFIKAAIERIDTGLVDQDDKAGWSLYFTRAKAKVELANETLRQLEESEDALLDEVSVAMSSQLDDAITDYEKGEQLIFEHGMQKEYSNDQLETIEAILKIADELGAIENEMEGESQDVQKKYLEWSKQRWLQILDKVPTSKGKAKVAEDTDNLLKITERANRGIGEYYLAVAAPMLSQFENTQEEDNEEDEPLSDEELEELKSLMGKAVESLLKAEDEEDGETLVMIAEAQISLANLYDTDSEEQKGLYSEAIIRLKKAQRLGYGSYQELISELEES